MKLGRITLAIVISLVLTALLSPAVQADDGKAEVELKVEVVSPLSVTTSNAWPIGTTWAILRGRLTGATSSVNVYFEYGTDTTYGSTTRVRTIRVRRHPRTFVAFISGLSPDTTYHFRAVAVADDTRSYGQDKSFKTRKRWWWR